MIFSLFPRSCSGIFFVQIFVETCPALHRADFRSFPRSALGLDFLSAFRVVHYGLVPQNCFDVANAQAGFLTDADEQTRAARVVPAVDIAHARRRRSTCSAVSSGHCTKHDRVVMYVFSIKDASIQSEGGKEAELAYH